MESHTKFIIKNYISWTRQIISIIYIYIYIYIYIFIYLLRERKSRQFDMINLQKNSPVNLRNNGKIKI